MKDDMVRVNLQRTWSAFLGRRHAIATSWQGLEVYGVEFGGGARLQYVYANIPDTDGCIHIMVTGFRAVEVERDRNGSVAQGKRR